MIREASRQEIDELLASRSIKHDGDIKCNCYVVEQGAYKMLLAITPVSDQACEAHIACPKEFVMRSRKLCQEGFEWLASSGWQKCYTAIKESQHKTAHNLCKRIGFTQVGCYNGHIVYERVLT